ncbi:MAG: SPW repeat protein [Candidatus Rokubacteria bacterium]|nr:SPW repeat protein [Candidatus Rokubacteria bacterium]
MKWASWTILALGLWLIVAPFALAYAGTTAAAYEDVILGIVIGALALWRGLGPETPSMTGVSWLLATGGLWVVLAPFVIGYAGTTAAVWNDVIVGLAVLILGAWQALSHHGGPAEMRHGMAAHH